MMFTLMICIYKVLVGQGIYFDIGGGVGMLSNDAQVKYSDASYTDNILYPRGLGFDLSGKAGYGPFDIPLFFVGDVSWNWSQNKVARFTDDIDNIFFGPGVVYYPSNYIQLATSIGFVYTILNSVPEYEVTNSHGEQFGPDTSNTGSNIGFGFNLSSAIDFGNKTSGLLVGGKFSYSSVDDLKVKDYRYGTGHIESRDELIYSLSTVYVGIFIKYRFTGL